MSRPARRPLGGLRHLLPGPADLVAARRQPGRDLLAGLTVAIVALPLALGFGVASGLGAQAGLITAVVAGTLAAVFGGSNLQVSGPTGAMTVVLIPIVAQHGPGGVLLVGSMAGILLIALALAGFGRYVRYLPTPVIEGFTVGIACVIALQQIPAALGVRAVGGEQVGLVALRAGRQFAHAPHWSALALSAGVAALMLAGARRNPRVPFSLVAVVLATVAADLVQLDVARIGALPSGLPGPSLAFVDAGAVHALLAPAVAVAMLAALESLLSATVADAMSVSQRHDPDRELFGQGIANLVTPIFGGVPATAAIARTAVNVRAGAASRLAALAHAVILAAIALLAGSAVGRIPLAALAGVLLATAVRMVEVGPLRAIIRSSRSDALVLAVTALATVVLNLVQAVIIGIIVAGALALRAVAEDVRLHQVPLDEDETGDHTAEEHVLLSEHIVAYRIDGPLFFAAAHRFLLELSEVAPVSVVILRMSRVSTIDASGALVLKDAIGRLEHRGIAVLVSGIRDEHHRALNALGVVRRLNEDGRVFATTPEAIAAARELLHDRGVLRPKAEVTQV